MNDIKKQSMIFNPKEHKQIYLSALNNNSSFPAPKTNAEMI